MLTNQELRTAAATEGKKTYSNGRPCQKGHLSERYVSNNMCIECTNANNKKLKVLAANSARRRNLSNSSQMVTATLTVQAQYKQMIDDISDIMFDGGARVDLVASFLSTIGRSTLMRDDLVRHGALQADGNLNRDTVAYRHNDAGHVEVQIVGDWYLADHVRELMDNTRKTIDRIPYRKGE